MIGRNQLRWLFAQRRAVQPQHPNAKGTIVDATIIGAPSSTKNKDGKRDPEMHQTAKGQQWYFGSLETPMANDGGIDYSKYTNAELSDVRLRIDQNRYPLNFVALTREIADRVQDSAKSAHAAGAETADLARRKYFTFWPRFWAGFLDGLFLRALGWIQTFIFGYTMSIPLRVSTLVFCSSFGLVYSIWMHARFGQTLGKMVCKVIVLDVSERPLSLRQAILRDIFSLIMLPILLAIEIPQVIRGVDPSVNPELSPVMWVLVSSGLILFLIEVATMLTNQKRRALHDFIAGSVVIRKSSLPLPLGVSVGR